MDLHRTFLALALTILGTGGMAVAATSDENFRLCRAAADSCDPRLLSEEQKRLVEIVAAGRNFAICVESNEGCDSTRLTPEQVQTVLALRAERRAARLEPILDSGRNFSACVNAEPGCDIAALTSSQQETLRRIVEERLEEEMRLAEVQHATEADDEAARQRRERWKRFGLGVLEFLGAVAEAYVEIESTKADLPRTIITSSGNVVSTNPNTRVIFTGQILQSEIRGKFEGWRGETIFQLTNGMIWQQAAYAYHYHYAYSPKVTIYRTGSGYRMKVEGVNQEIQVRQLK